MLKKIKQKITLENLLCLFIIICPILDIISFIFRNYFKTSISPTTILRPIIPIVVFAVLFFKENNKKQKILVMLTYFLYSITHLIIFKQLKNGSSYGSIANEAQYLINYFIMIVNIYIFFKVIKDKGKVEKSVFISLLIYIITLYFSIITKTSSSTYLEKIGYKGYFESGNSLCTVLLLELCIILGKFEIKDLKKVILIIFTGIYLTMLSGMRTGLFGFGLIIGIYIIGKFLENIKENKKFSKKQIVSVTLIVILTIIAIFILGSKTLQRRKLLMENEKNNIDNETGEERYVTGDILNLYKKIKNGELEENFMSEAEKRAIVEFCDYAKKIKLSNVNLRKQQLIYNIILVKEQKNPILILFGNGYKNQTGELVMEMEIPAILLNFGIVGFILYMGPIIYILGREIYIFIKNKNQEKIENIMYITGSLLAIGLSCFSGYVYFSLSSMTMAIVLLLCFERKECK